MKIADEVRVISVKVSQPELFPALHALFWIT